MTDKELDKVTVETFYFLRDPYYKIGDYNLDTIYNEVINLIDEYVLENIEVINETIKLIKNFKININPKKEVTNLDRELKILSDSFSRLENKKVELFEKLENKNSMFYKKLYKLHYLEVEFQNNIRNKWDKFNLFKKLLNPMSQIKEYQISKSICKKIEEIGDFNGKTTLENSKYQQTLNDIKNSSLTKSKFSYQFEKENSNPIRAVLTFKNMIHNIDLISNKITLVGSKKILNKFNEKTIEDLNEIKVNLIKDSQVWKEMLTNKNLDLDIN